MQFRINDTGALVNESEFRSLYPNISFPAVISDETLENFGVLRVQSIAQPEHTAFQTVQDDGVQLDPADGVWKQTWSVQDITDAVQIAAIKAAQEEQLVDGYVRAMDALLHGEAAKKGYDTIRSAALRAGYPGPFHDEGVAFATWMDQCYSAGYTIIANVKSGARAIPTVEQMLAELPPAPVFA